MQQIPLQAVPNQSFSLLVDSNSWDITLKATGGIMSISLTLNNVDLYDSLRVVAGQFVIPYEYQEAGNFLFITQSQQLPDYTQFGVTQQLIYISPAELAAARVPMTGLITAADFNPIAALPLRFSPQGYQ